MRWVALTHTAFHLATAGSASISCFHTAFQQPPTGSCNRRVAYLGTDCTNSLRQLRYSSTQNLLLTWYMTQVFRVLTLQSSAWAPRSWELIYRPGFPLYIFCHCHGDPRPPSLKRGCLLGRIADRSGIDRRYKTDSRGLRHIR